MRNNISEDIIIDNTTITVEEQMAYMNIMATMQEDTTPENLYKNIDTMPESIKKVVSPIMDIDAIKSIVIFLATLYILSALFTFLESISMTVVANKFAYSLRARIISKINKLPLKYFDTHKTGDVLSRVTNDVDTIAQSMNQSLASLVSAITLFIGTTIMMFYTNALMAITAILASLIGFVLMMLILSKSQKYFADRQKELGALNGHIEEVYSGLNIVKAYNGKRPRNGRYQKRIYASLQCGASRQNGRQGRAGHGSQYRFGLPSGHSESFGRKGRAGLHFGTGPVRLPFAGR